MSPTARTTLVSGLLFVCACGLARMRKGRLLADAAPPETGVEQPDSSRGGGAKRNSGEKPGATAAWQDTLLTQALDGRDLVAAVREIMDRQDEDHCADTRLVCLVEGLPAARLGELVGLLEAFPDDAYVHRFILRTWVQRDSDAAFAYLKAHPAQRSKHMPDLLEGLTKKDPQAALAWLDTKQPAPEARAARVAVLGTLAESDPAQALQILQQKGWLAQSPNLISRIIRNYGALKPQEAVTALRGLLTSLEPSQRNSQNFASLYRALLNGARDAGTGLAEGIHQQLTEEERRSGAGIYAEEVATRESGGLERLLKGPLDNLARMSLVSDHADELFKNFADLPDDEFRVEVLIRVQGLSSLPPAIAEFIEKRPEAERENILSNLVASISRNSLPAALTLWDKLSENGKSSTGPRLLKDYAEKSPAQALAELQKQSESVQEACLKGLCAGMVSTQPQQAMDLALLQPDPAVQASCLAAVFQFWGTRSEKEAVAALEANAARINLPALLSSLPSAGSLGNAHYSVKSGELEAVLRKLIGSPVAPTNEQ